MVEEEDESIYPLFCGEFFDWPYLIAIADEIAYPVVQEGVLSLKLHNFCIAAERITHENPSFSSLSA